MDKTNVNIEPLFTEIATSLTKKHFLVRTDDVISRAVAEDWKPYVDLAFKLHTTFTNLLTAENTFISEKTAFTFSRQLLNIFDGLAYAVVSPEISKEILEQIEVAKQLHHDNMPDMPDADSLDDVKAFTEKIKKLVSQYSNSMNEAEVKLRELTTKFIFAHTQRLLTLFQSCESPLEKAFLIGLVAYDPPPYYLWARNEIFFSQLKTGNYRLDFAVQDTASGIKVDIELDGHNYHEKTEEQAVSDRSRDRTLLQQGWKVVRFHRKEIEEDLEGCIKQASEVWYSEKAG